MTTDSYQAMAILQCAKNTLGDDKVFCVAGGHHPSLAPYDFHHVSIIDAIAIGEGEETFKELIDHLVAKQDWRTLQAIDGLCFFDETAWVTTTKRAQSRTMDSFPLPNRSLLKKYGRSYFFMSAMPMASLSTSRGCAYDCNFCGLWEFYEKKVRFLSVERICDALEQMDETFVMFLDDNFLTSKQRLEGLCDEIDRRGTTRWSAPSRVIEELLLRAPTSEAKSWLAKVLVDEYGEGSEGKDHRTLYRECLVAAGLVQR